MRGGAGSRPGGNSLGGDGEESTVKMVWSGRVGSQESIQCAVGSKPPKFGDTIVAAWLLKLVMLFWRENEGCPAGILPRAFSDMPRSWVGRGSSMDEDTEGFREA